MAAKIGHSLEEFSVFCNVSAHVSFGVGDNHTHRSLRVQHATAFAEKFERVAALQMLQKMLTMDMANAAIFKWQWVKRIEVK